MTKQMLLFLVIMITFSSLLRPEESRAAAVGRCFQDQQTVNISFGLEHWKDGKKIDYLHHKWALNCLHLRKVKGHAAFGTQCTLDWITIDSKEADGYSIKRYRTDDKGLELVFADLETGTLDLRITEILGKKPIALFVGG